MKKKTATPTKTGEKKKSEVKSNRKNTTASTRNASRQRSGNNDPQHGSH